MMPTQILLATYILIKTWVLASLARFVATLVAMVGNLPYHKYFHKNIMDSKDEQMKATSVILRSMKILKLQWFNSLIR